MIGDDSTPRFDFKCVNTECNYKFTELIFNSKEEEILECPKCKSKVSKLFSPPTTIRFRGNGWTPNLSRDSTGNLQEETIITKETLKNLKSSEVYDVQKPKDLG